MDNKNNKTIVTGLGDFSTEKFSALLKVREVALRAIVEQLTQEGYVQVTTSSLVNIAGSCENPQASFTLNYYGRYAHLSQSAQLQLEKLVLALKMPVFTVNNSFREEHFDDPQAKGRRLSEFTLIEPEAPYPNHTPQEALTAVMGLQEKIIKNALKEILKSQADAISLLGGDVNYLKKVAAGQSFSRITYDDALKLLNTGEFTKIRGKDYIFGDDLGIQEEREILKAFSNVPTFVTHYPTAIKFFNMKRLPDGKRVYSVDLLTPNLGETSGGAVREEDGEIIKQQLMESRIANFLRAKGQNPLEPFNEYFSIFKQREPLLRAGFGIGFERFVGFLLNSNDILNTVTYRSLQP